MLRNRTTQYGVQRPLLFAFSNFQHPARQAPQERGYFARPFQRRLTPVLGIAQEAGQGAKPVRGMNLNAGYPRAIEDPD